MVINEPGLELASIPGVSGLGLFMHSDRALTFFTNPAFKGVLIYVRCTSKISLFYWCMSDHDQAPAVCKTCMIA